MSVHRLRTLALTGTFAAALLAPAGLAQAQTAPPADQPPATLTITPRDSAIVKPLVEIGRVRARTPYCAALAKARPGIDAAITFEYLAPQLAKDLRGVRFDSELHRHLALNQVDVDLAALGDLASRGRAEVLALRKAAYADGVDDQKRNEMLAVANAIDGAKERQKFLAKRVARIVAVYHEAPIHTIVTQAGDDPSKNALHPGPLAAETSDTPVTNPFAPAQPFQKAPQIPDSIEAVNEHDRVQQLFSTFGGEDWIRGDMEDAAKHAKAAMQLGGCSL